MIGYGFESDRGSGVAGEVAGLGYTENYLRGSEAEMGVLNREQLGDSFQSLLGQVLYVVEQGRLVAGTGLIEGEGEVGLVVAPLVDGGAVNPVLASDGGDGFAG